MNCGWLLALTHFEICRKKKQKKNKLTTYGYNFQYGCILTVVNMTSQVTCFSTLFCLAILLGNPSIRMCEVFTDCFNFAGTLCELSSYRINP